MYQYLQKLRPETIRVFAACLEHRRRLGEMPSAAMVLRLAEEEGASPGAALVLARYELLTEDGRTLNLAWSGKVIVRDAETLYAVLARGLPKARLHTPDGRWIKKPMVDLYADGWEEAVGT